MHISCVMLFSFFILYIHKKNSTYSKGWVLQLKGGAMHPSSLKIVIVRYGVYFWISDNKADSLSAVS